MSLILTLIILIMTKKLEFIRKAVIMACNPDCKSYDEALRKEYDVPGCRAEYTNCNGAGKLVKRSLTKGGIFIEETIEKYEVKIIGQPITLAKILITLEDQGEWKIETKSHEWRRFFIEVYGRDCNPMAYIKLFEWGLAKDLDQQPETILAISKLLGYGKK